MSGRNPHGYAERDDPHTITLTHDEVLILFEYFERLEEEGALRFRHPAEWTALGRFTAQLESIPWEVFDPAYDRLLAEARGRYAAGFEGHVPGVGYVAVDQTGRMRAVEPPDDPRS